MTRHDASNQPRPVEPYEGWTAFACFITAIVAVGGLEDPDATRPSNYPLGIIMLACCAYIMSTIYRKK